MTTITVSVSDAPDMTWREFLANYADTLGITALFAFFGSGFLLWAGVDAVTPISKGRALIVLAAGQFVSGIATAFVHGYLGWSIFAAPAVGSVCGLVALPIIMAVAKGGRRVEMRADDLADKGIDLLPGRKSSND